MARPIKNNADYFPHDNDLRNDRRCKALRSKYGIEGYGILIMYLEALAQAEHFKIKHDSLETELLAGDFDTDVARLNEITEYLLTLGLLEKENEFVFSPLHNPLQKILSEYREKERNRKNGKIKQTDVFRPENSKQNTHSEIFHTENPTEQIVFHAKNTQRKGNENKEKETKENIINGEAPDFNFCKDFFLKEAKGYYWEAKDDEPLIQLLRKILAANPNTGAKYGFQIFIKGLPTYWRSKKFTMQHLNTNFNEINTEMRAKIGGKTVYTAPIQVPYRHIQSKTDTLQEKSSANTNQQTEEQKLETEQKLIKQVCDGYENYCNTGNFNVSPIRLVYDLLTRKKLLQLSVEEQKEYEAKSLEKRKLELSKPKNRDEKFKFKFILQNYSKGIDANEQGRIDRLKKELIVRDFLTRCKEKNIEFNTLFTKTL